MVRFWATLIGLTVVGMLVTTAKAAPAPPATKTVETWEYLEITAAGRTVLRGGVGGAVQPVQPAQPNQAPPIRFTTGKEEIDATGWEDLAKQLKLPEGKKETTPNGHKLRVFNYLGEQGWEMVAGQQTPTSGLGSWTFKRKVIKEVKENKESREPTKEK